MAFDFAEPAGLGAVVPIAIYLVVYFCLLVFVVAMILVRRNHRVISPRTPVYLVLIQIYMFIMCAVMGITIILGKPPYCDLLNAVVTGLPFFSLHFTLNIPAMVMQSDLNAVKVNRAQGVGHDLRIWTIIKFFGFWPRLLYMAVTEAIVIAAVLSIMYFSSLEGDCMRPSTLVLSGYLIAFMVGLSYFLIRFNKISDPFYLRLENNISSMVSIPVMFIMLTYPIVPSIYGDWFDYRYNLMFLSLTTIFLNGLLPVLLTFPRFEHWVQRIQGNVISHSSQKDLDTKGTIFALSQGVDVFQAVLNHPILFEEFMAFTVAEWCVENVLFYKAVEEFKAHYKEDPKRSRERASQIIREYLVPGASLEVNIDAYLRKSIIKDAEVGFSETMFDQAQRSVCQLMQRDSFSKWQLTPQFKAALEKAMDSKKSNSSTKGSSRQSLHVSG